MTRICVQRLYTYVFFNDQTFFPSFPYEYYKLYRKQSSETGTYMFTKSDILEFFLKTKFFSSFHKKNKISSQNQSMTEVNLKLALRCLNGAIKDNTEALYKMRERQEKTTELPSSPADDLKKSGDEQRVFSKT